MLVIGAKGHAKEILSVIEQLEIQVPIYFFDNTSTDIGSMLFTQYQIIKKIEHAQNVLLEDNRVVLGVGKPSVRYKLAQKFIELGGILTSIVSPYAQVGRYEVQLGEGLNVMHAVMISNSVSIGEGSLINAFTSVHHDVKVGRYNEISPGVRLLGNCVIGDFCQIGASATILPGIKVGNNVIIGAGAVVTKDIEDNAVAVGMPARIIKKLPNPDWT